MKYFLPTALEPLSFQFDLKSNTTTAKTNDFQTNASVIAGLLVLAGNMATKYSSFDAASPFNLDSDAQRLYSFHNKTDISELQRIPTSRLAGLLPPESKSSELQDRTWLLEHIAAFAHAATSWSNVSSVERWTLNVSRVNITPSIWVGAVTMESEVIPLESSNQPYVKSPTGRLTFHAADDYANVQIHAYAVCINKNGTETLISVLKRVEPPAGQQVECVNSSITPMYIFSSGRYLVADAITVSNEVLGIVKANNLRVVTSSTFAHVTWDLQDLAEIYSAVCTVKDKCSGLDAILSGTNQRLLMGESALPVRQLYPVNFVLALKDKFYTYEQRPVELVSVDRTSYFTNQRVDKLPLHNSRPKLTDITFTEYRDSSDKHPGDVLMPHNVRAVSMQSNHITRLANGGKTFMHKVISTITSTWRQRSKQRTQRLHTSSSKMEWLVMSSTKPRHRKMIMCCYNWIAISKIWWYGYQSPRQMPTSPLVGVSC